MDSKKDLRKKVLNIRNNMNKKDVCEKSNAIINKVIKLDEYKNSKTVFIYMDFNNEVQTLDLIQRMLKEGKRVFVPYTDSINVKLIPSELTDLEKDLQKSNFGYLEPKKETIKEISIDKIDLIIVPGVVFDISLNRIGFGKGYYDRILCQKRKDTKAIAIAYEFQVLDEVPHEEHDIKMDMIVTESNIYKRLSNRLNS